MFLFLLDVKIIHRLRLSISINRQENDRLHMELDRMRAMGGSMGGGMGGMDGYGSLGRSRSPDPRVDPSYGTRVAVEVSDLQDRLAKSESELRKSQAELRLNQGDYERSHAELEQMQEKVLDFYLISIFKILDLYLMDY